MASRNIVIKNNTRFFKSAQFAVVFGLLFLDILHPFFAIHSCAFSHSNNQCNRQKSGFVNHRHHYVHVQFVTVPFCVSSREWG